MLGDFSALLRANEVVEVLETVEVSAEILKLLWAYSLAGFQIIFDDDVFAVELANLGILGTVKAARQHGTKLLAKRVEKREQFEQYKRLGFQYFQGYYFARPENLAIQVLNPSQAAVLKLMDQVRQEADVKQIEKGFKRDATLTFKLLRSINSATLGPSCEIQSIRHAVSILGYRQLYKWLTPLLATVSPSPLAPVLTHTAVTRGRLCELLGVCPPSE